VLAADYAALAARDHLPKATAVYSFYPGRKPIGGHWTSSVPLSDLAKIPADTQLSVFAGATTRRPARGRRAGSSPARPPCRRAPSA